jgi:TRAP-type C4-dicarboxylate transport system substrate-binding protein
MGCDYLKSKPGNMGSNMARLLLCVLFCLSPNEPVLATTFKIATEAPDGLSFMKKVRAATRQITSDTQGRVKFKIYPGGVQGDDQTVLRKMRAGQLQGGMVAAGSLTKFYPDLQVYNLPSSFRSYAEVDAVRKHLDEVIIEGLKSAGIIPFGLTETGFAYILSNTPITSLADALKLKVWIPASDPTVLSLIKSFGISPIPLKFADVLPGLQTGLIDAVASPPVVVIAMQWHTGVKYITQLPIMYIYSMLMLDQKAFDKISAVDKLIVETTLTQVFAEIAERNRADNLAAYNVILGQEIQPVRPSAAELLEWQSKSDASVRDLVEAGNLSREIVDQLYKHLSEIRDTDASMELSDSK